VAANLAAIIGGVLVFDEPIGSGPLEIGARFIAFCLVIAGAALMPGHRTEHRAPVDPPAKVTSQDRSRAGEASISGEKTAIDRPVAASTSAHARGSTSASGSRSGQPDFSPSVSQ
jgi:hypothetical protein